MLAAKFVESLPAVIEPVKPVAWFRHSRRDPVLLGIFDCLLGGEGPRLNVSECLHSGTLVGCLEARVGFALRFFVGLDLRGGCLLDLLRFHIYFE